MRSAIGILAAAACLLAAPAGAATVGVVAPLDGPSGILGNQIRDGAIAAAELTDGAITIRSVDDQCTAEGGRAAAERLAAAKVSVVIGFLCTESIEAALPVLKEAGIPVVAVGVRANSLTDRRARTGWPVLRLGPRADSERDAAARIFPRLWEDRLFAVVDDGTIYGRELAETVRLACEQAGMKAVFADTFRPQLENQAALIGRLKRAGATEVFAGGDRDDIAIMGRDSAAADAGLTIAGGEALRAAPGPVPLAAGTLMVAMPEWEVGDPAAKAVYDRRKVVPEGYVLQAHAAIEVVAAVAAALPDGRKPTVQDFAGRDFPTVIGPIRFAATGDLAENPYRLFRFDGSRFVPADVPE